MTFTSTPFYALLRYLCIAGFFINGTGSFVSAQEESGDDVVNEIRQRLKGAEVARDLLRRQTKLADRRIELLNKALAVRGQQKNLVERIEQAEKNGDDDKVDSLQEQIELKDIWLEMSSDELELLRQTDEIFHVARDMMLDLEVAATDFEPFEKLLQIQRQRLDLHREMFGAIETGNDDEVEEIEEKLGEMGEQFEMRFEQIELRRELRYAQEEGEEEAVEELKHRLDELREELGESKDEKSEHEAARSKLDVSALPISLTDEEIVAAGKQPFDHRMSGLLASACNECHDTANAMGDLDLERLVSMKPLVVNRKHWINVIEQLRNRSMPPADAESPSEPDRRYMAAWLTDKIENFDYSTVRQVGYEPAKRLTHDEYNNTIRDLFGTDLRPADKFPDDMVASSGFDNSANSLFIQPITMERYVGAADEVAESVFSQGASRMRFFHLPVVATIPMQSCC